MPSPLVAVVKVGGSLLSLPDVAVRVESLLRSRPDVRPVLLAGGGELADAVRIWDGVHALGDDASHDLAMETLDVTARLVARLIPRGQLVETRTEAEACWLRGERPVVRNLAAQIDGVPHTWDVTSDSLAARLAAQWRGDELWLLKSAELPEGISFAEASRRELVDRHFPQVAGEVGRVLWCNLRGQAPGLRLWGG